MLSPDERGLKQLCPPHTCNSAEVGASGQAAPSVARVLRDRGGRQAIARPQRLPLPLRRSSVA